MDCTSDALVDGWRTVCRVVGDFTRERLGTSCGRLHLAQRTDYKWRRFSNVVGTERGQGKRRPDDRGWPLLVILSERSQKRCDVAMDVSANHI